MNTEAKEVLTPNQKVEWLSATNDALKGQIASLIKENEALSEEAERLSVLAANVETDRMRAEAQRDVIQERAVELARRLTTLVGPMAVAMDALREQWKKLGEAQNQTANVVQGLVTQEQLETQLSEWSATTIRLCRGSEGEP